MAGILLIGCSEKYDVDSIYTPALYPRFLNVSPTSMTFNASATETQPLTIKSSETPWKIENGVEWIKISTTSGNSSMPVPVGVDENVIGDVARTGLFLFKSEASDWDFETPISVTQAGAYPVICFSRNNLEFGGAVTSDTVKVSANCTWLITATSEDWLTATATDDIILLSTTANEKDDYRTAIVTVSHTGNINISENIIVKQAPATIAAGTDSIHVDNSGASINMTIESEAPWTASTESSWIDINPTSGSAGTIELTIDVAPNTTINDRKGYLVISIGDSKRIQIPIVQNGCYIKVENDKLFFDADGGTLDFTIDSNTDWEITSLPDWIAVDSNSGNGSKTVKVTAKENPNTSNRSAVIHVTQSGLDIDCEINVSQKGKYFDVKTTTLNFDDKQSTKEVKIETDGTWVATTTSDWITLTPNTASRDSVLTVGVSENISGNERSDSIIITMGDRTTTINVVQKSKYFTVSNNLLTYTSKGGDIKVSITTTEQWSASIENEPDWISLSANSGSGDIDVIVTASDNASVNSRSATIIFETTYFQSIKVEVSQEARFLKVDTREILFYPRGGTSDPVTVTTDGTYKVETTDTWLSITESGNTFTVAATENKDNDPRTGTITISLSDLTEGAYSLSLSVTQLNEGGSFIRTEYGDDQNYDADYITNGNLTITGLGETENWSSKAYNSARVLISNIREHYLNRYSNSRINVNVKGLKKNE